jgi:hypothetical protein
MIAAVQDVWMTLWNGKVEKIILFTPLVDEIRLSICKKIVITAEPKSE